MPTLLGALPRHADSPRCVPEKRSGICGMRRISKRLTALLLGLRIFARVCVSHLLAALMLFLEQCEAIFHPLHLRQATSLIRRH